MRSERPPTVPAPLALLLRPLPLAPLALALRRLGQGVTGAHPSLLARLGEHAEKRFLVDPTDLPFVFLVRPGTSRPAIVPFGRGRLPAFDARIAGPLAVLLGMVHGALDGDALFFSGDLAIEGDTEAVLALRNALDDAELDLAGEFLGALGPLASLVEPLARSILAGAQRLTGVALTRVA